MPAAKNQYRLSACLLMENDRMHFLYGRIRMANPNDDEAVRHYSPEKNSIYGGAQLIMYSVPLSTESLNQLRCAAKAGCIEYRLDDGVELKISGVCRQSIIQLNTLSPLNDAPKSWGQSIQHLDVFYASLDADTFTLFRESPSDFTDNVFEFLKQNTGCDFKIDYAARLGCLEFADQNHSYVDQDICFRQINDDQVKPFTAFHIQRKGAWLNKSLIAIAEGRTQETTIFDRLLYLPQGSHTSGIIQANESIENIQLKIYTEGGQLLYIENSHFLMRVHANTHITGNRFYMDQVPRKQRALNEKAGPIELTSSLPSISQFDDPSFWLDREKTFEQQAQWRFGTHKNTGYKDHWFYNNSDGEYALLKYFERLSQRSDIHHVYLVDPFFSVSALSRIGVHLINHNYKLTVLCSIQEESEKTALDSALNENPRLFAEAIRVRSLLTSKNKQAFHDRYLVIEKSEGLPEIYLLSNSLNAAAHDWPFCMSNLDIPTAKVAHDYIKTLINTDLDPGLKTDYEWQKTWQDFKVVAQPNIPSPNAAPKVVGALKWLFGLSSSESAVEAAYNLGLLVNREHGWRVNGTLLLSQLNHRLAMTNGKTLVPSDWASLLIGLGELSARCHVQIDEIITNCLQTQLSDESFRDCISRVADQTQHDPHHAKHFQRKIKTEIFDNFKALKLNYSLYQKAHAAVEYCNGSEPTELYGYAWTMWLLLNARPIVFSHAIMKLDDQFLIYTLCGHIAEELLHRSSDLLMAKLLKSPSPWFKALALAYTNTRNRHEYSVFRYNTESLVQLHRENGVEPSLTILLLADRLQSSFIKTKHNQSLQDYIATEPAKTWITEIKALWKTNELTDEEISNLFAAFRGSAFFLMHVMPDSISQNNRQALEQQCRKALKLLIESKQYHQIGGLGVYDDDTRMNALSAYAVLFAKLSKDTTNALKTFRNIFNKKPTIWLGTIEKYQLDGIYSGNCEVAIKSLFWYSIYACHLLTNLATQIDNPQQYISFRKSFLQWALKLIIHAHDYHPIKAHLHLLVAMVCFHLRQKPDAADDNSLLDLITHAEFDITCKLTLQIAVTGQCNRSTYYDIDSLCFEKPFSSEERDAKFARLILLIDLGMLISHKENTDNRWFKMLWEKALLEWDVSLCPEFENFPDLIQKALSGEQQAKNDLFANEGLKATFCYQYISTLVKPVTG